VSTEDDEWALYHLRDGDHLDNTFGVGTYRWRDEHGVVHRAVWTRKARGWASLCGTRLPREQMTSEDDPGGVTCIQCLTEEP